LDFQYEILWQIKRHDPKDFLFIGFHTDLIAGIEGISNYSPRFAMLPLSLPTIVEKCLYYTCSFSLALAMINIVPCLMLDGHFVIKTFLALWCTNTATAEYISKFFVYFGSSLLLANMFLTFLLL